MGFLFKAGFWFVIVLLFLPENSQSIQDQRDFAQNSARSLIEVTNEAAQFCNDRPKVCDSAAQTSKLAAEYLNMATEQLAQKPIQEN